MSSVKAVTHCSCLGDLAACKNYFNKFKEAILCVFLMPEGYWKRTVLIWIGALQNGGGGGRRGNWRQELGFFIIWFAAFKKIIETRSDWIWTQENWIQFLVLSQLLWEFSQVILSQIKCISHLGLIMVFPPSPLPFCLLFLVRWCLHSKVLISYYVSVQCLAFGHAKLSWDL